MGAHFTTLDTSEAVRPRMTADHFGMGNLAHDPERGEAQTARSIGMEPAWVDIADAVDLASLAAGQRRHAYRMAADAVDHLIALMDAVEIDGEDLEEGHDAESFADDDDDKSDREPSLGACENHPSPWHVDMDDRYHVGRRHHPLGDQTAWAAGNLNDLEDPTGDLESEAGYDLPEGDDERCGSEHDGREPDDDGETTAPERHGKGFVRCGRDDAEDTHDAEPSLGARNPTFGGSLGDSVSQVGWAMDSDDTDRECDTSEAEPYLSVVEFDGVGDNWSRTGNATSGHGTDVEDVNNDGSDDGRQDPGWFLGETDIPLILRGMREDAARIQAGAHV